MEVIVKSMAQLSVPEDLFNDLDMPGLLTSFKSDYDKLDDIKDAREKHESRGFWGRLWNKNEVKNAQLSAVEVQASFSKKIGQLMMISIAQSQMLNQQQLKLQTQQQEIKEQTEEIALANKKIAVQQNSLSQQQEELDKLIKEYFELKGLTVEGAKQLIAIANEVKQTKAELISAFEKERQEVVLVKQNIENVLNKQLEQVAQFLDQSKRDSEQLKSGLQEEFHSKAVAMDQKFETYSKETNENIAGLQTQFGAQLNAQSEELKKQEIKNDQLGEKLQSDLVAQRASTDESLGLMQKQLQTLKWVAISGVGAAVLSLALLVWAQHSVFGF